MRRFLLRDPLIFLLILFILTAAAGLAAAEIQYEDYRQKIEIISELVAAEMSAEEWNSPDESPEHPVLTEAVQLLKGHGEEHVRGRKILSSYGYSDGIFTGWAQANYYLRRLYISWAATAALCVLIYLLLCALYIFQRRRARGKERKRIEDVAPFFPTLRRESMERCVVTNCQRKIPRRISCIQGLILWRNIFGLPVKAKKKKRLRSPL